MQTDLSSLFLSTAGVVLSLAFTYIPGLKTWYEKLSGYKALIMVALVLVVSLVYFGLGCTPFGVRIGIEIPCDVDGAITVALAFVRVLVANQTAYLLTKRDN